MNDPENFEDEVKVTCLDKTLELLITLKDTLVSIVIGKEYNWEKKGSKYRNNDKLTRGQQKLLNQALHKAVAGHHNETLGWTEGGDLDEIEQLIENGGNLNYLDENGNNAYHEACNKGQLDTIELLLDYFPDTLNQRNKYNRSVASITATGKNLEAFAWLVARGLKFWFAAVIEMEWTDEEILETLDRVKKMEMDTKLLDKTIMEDYSKLEPIVKQNIIKQRPKIKEVILEARKNNK